MSTELAPKMGSLGASLMDDEQRAAILDPNKGKYLPMLKVVYGIEADSEPKLGPFIMKAILADGDNIKALPKGWRLTVLSARPAYRVKKPDGKFEKAYGPVEGRPGKSHERFLELEKLAKAQTKGVDQGASALCAVITDEGVAIAVLQAYKSTLSYWSKVIHHAVLAKKGLAVIEIADHAGNLVPGGGGKYLSGKKFTQYEIEEVTADDYKAVEAAYKDNEEAVKNWLAQ